jgi:3-methyladenine DNA glycosylase AlkD
VTNTQELVQEIRETLEGKADPERTEWAKGNYPTALHVIGVKVPDINNLVKDLAKRLRKAPVDEVIELTKALTNTGILECQQVACKLLEKHKAATTALRLEDVEALAQGLDNWVSVDNFAGLVAGPAWRQGQIPDEVVREWALSENRWRRRAAVVCTVALNQKARGGTGDAPRTLDICRLVARTTMIWSPKRSRGRCVSWRSVTLLRSSSSSTSTRRCCPHGETGSAQKDRDRAETVGQGTSR